VNQQKAIDPYLNSERRLRSEAEARARELSLL
jgi:hypothetical protein